MDLHVSKRAKVAACKNWIGTTHRYEYTAYIQEDWTKKQQILVSGYTGTSWSQFVQFHIMSRKSNDFKRLITQLIVLLNAALCIENILQTAWSGTG